MKILLNESKLEIINLDVFTKRVFSLMGKKVIDKAYLFQEENKIHTYFLKTNVDIIGFNKKNIVFFKYLDVPKNKIIEISSDKINTDILVVPKNYSKEIKIGDELTFIRE